MGLVKQAKRAVRRALNPIAKTVGGLQARIAARDPRAVVLDLERQLQRNEYECGAAGPFAILRYHGKGRSLDATALAVGTTEEDGTSEGPILRLFRARGLRPIVKARATLRDVRAGIDAGAPVLVCVNQETHWSVVYGYSRDRIWLADPSAYQAFAREAITNAEFRERWDNRWAVIVRAGPRRRRAATVRTARRDPATSRRSAPLRSG